MPKLIKSLKKRKKYSRIQQEKKLNVTDLIEGTAQLAASGMLEATELAEAIHKEILLQPFKIWDSINKGSNCQQYAEIIYQQTTGKAYKLIKSIAEKSGYSTAETLRFIDSNLPSSVQNKTLSSPTQRIVSAVNGMLGDHLVDMNNPLAIPMHLYNYTGRVHHLQHLPEHVIILVHGLCLNHLYWRPKDDKSLGKQLKSSFSNAQILYLNYNTGKRISKNGENFSQLLTKVVEHNPQIKRIDIIGHSMGGLVSRSAMYYGEKQQAPWINKINNFVTLCSPHNGALLERISFFVQKSLSRVPVAGNFARLGNIKSAGILDLRHGNVRHKDWQSNENRIGRFKDSRNLAPLPSNVTTYLVAATLDSESDKSHEEMLGDGLVSVSSALGERYVDYYSYYSLQVPPEQKIIFYNMNHMNILHSSKVHKSIILWLKTPISRQEARKVV